MSSICIPVILNSNPLILFMRLKIRKYKPYFYLNTDKIAKGNEVAFIISIEHLLNYIQKAKEHNIKKSKIVVFTNKYDLSNHKDIGLLFKIIYKLNINNFKPKSIRIRNISEVIFSNAYEVVNEKALIQAMKYLANSYSRKPFNKKRFKKFFK